MPQIENTIHFESVAKHYSYLHNNSTHNISHLSNCTSNHITRRHLSLLTMPHSVVLFPQPHLHARSISRHPPPPHCSQHQIPRSETRNFAVVSVFSLADSL
ncbi:hypothetical protein CDAR_27771 [Caerostris darwini]|uniref:Uncharacterized protein n=1 Tax=Caerostris darwini TaxID=1538125 RepID=A0AAV4STJ4_9ARAC|nr:hypothetical protein CDAR_27771 [Caerostris darwini]